MLSKTIALTFAFLASFSAIADTANLTYNNPTLTSGSGTLDVNGALGLSSVETASFNSAVLQFNFEAPYLDLTYTGVSVIQHPDTYDTRVVCNWFSCKSELLIQHNFVATYSYEGRHQTTTTTVDGTSIDGAAPFEGGRFFNNITQDGAFRNASGDLERNEYYNYSEIRRWNGSFSSTLAVNSATLDKLSTTGLLDFSVLFSNAAITLESINLTVDYSVTAVPEPETYAMMLAGLGVMGAIARRRKAKQTV